MATIKEYRDGGGYYILKGYPVGNSKGEDDMICATLQVFPRAETFFKETGYRDGRKIEREVFYALVLDRDISSPSLERNPPTVECLPYEILYIVEGLAESEHLGPFLKKDEIRRCRYLIDYYREIRKLGQKNPELAANICLAQHIRQAGYERAQQIKHL